MPKALVIYHSQEFGNTAAVADLVARGLRECGVDVEMINTNEVNRVDLHKLAAADGIAFGSPDYGSYTAGTIKQVFDDLWAGRREVNAYGKPVVLFMTHGGGGRGITPFIEMVEPFKLVAPPFTCQRRPPEGCPEAIELGRALARAITG